MRIISSLLLLTLIVACFYFSYTDLKYNQIKTNKLLAFGVVGVVLDILLYGGYQQDKAKYAALAFIVLVIIAVGLYAMHIWAAGDSKLMILLGMLVPPLNSERGIMMFNEIMIPVYAFGLGFLYLIADTGIHLIKREYHINRMQISDRIKMSACQFVVNCVYIVAILKIENFILQKWDFQLGSFQLIFNICLLILISRIPVLYSKTAFGIILGASVLYSFGTGVWMLEPIRIVYYCVSFLYVVMQIFIGEFNYKEINTEDVREGMILSMGTSMMLMQSRIKGLPGISFEDMRSRINAEEVEAILRWKKSKRGKDKIVIVRKVPFALFISFGCMLYLVIRSIR